MNGWRIIPFLFALASMFLVVISYEAAQYFVMFVWLCAFIWDAVSYWLGHPWLPEKWVD